MAKDQVVEVTTRTTQSLYLLSPSKEVNRVILGVLGRALEHHPRVALHAFVVMSNHVHLLLTPGDAPTLAAFMRFVNGNIARKIGKLRNWCGPFWGRRYESIVTLDETSQIDRLRYISSHGVKEGLVDEPSDWPGLSSVEMLLSGAPLEGDWINETALHAARRRKCGHLVDVDEFSTTYAIKLTPLPCWRRLSSAQQQEAVATMVGDIVAQGAQKRARHGSRSVGRVVILAQSPHHRPEVTKRSPAPLVHAATAHARRVYRAWHREVTNAHRRCVAAIREGRLDVSLPESTFLPSGLPLIRRQSRIPMVDASDHGWIGS